MCWTEQIVYCVVLDETCCIDSNTRPTFILHSSNTIEMLDEMLDWFNSAIDLCKQKMDYFEY